MIFWQNSLPLPELLPDDLHNVVRVAVRLGKDQCFGNFPSAGEQFGKQVLPEGANHRADLAGVDNIPVQLGGAVIYVLVHLLPTLLPGEAVSVLNHLLHDVGAALGHLRLNEEDILPYVDAVDNGLLPGVLTDHIFVEEGKGALVRRGGQANQEGVEVVQHLLPHIVDGSVTLVNDDAVKRIPAGISRYIPPL